MGAVCAGTGAATTAKVMVGITGLVPDLLRICNDYATFHEFKADNAPPYSWDPRLAPPPGPPFFVHLALAEMNANGKVSAIQWHLAQDVAARIRENGPAVGCQDTWAELQYGSDDAVLSVLLFLSDAGYIHKRTFRPFHLD